MSALGLDIVDFVTVGIECTLRQLLEAGFFHAGEGISAKMPMVLLLLLPPALLPGHPALEARLAPRSVPIRRSVCVVSPNLRSPLHVYTALPCRPAPW